MDEDKTCPVCGQVDDEHCQQCWACPGTPHEDMCGF